MNFIEAIKAMQDGKGVRLPHWRARSHIKKDENVESGYVICLDQRVKYYQFKETEMLFDEWEIYKDEPKLHTLDEALKALKNGAKIYRKSRSYQVYRKSDRQFLFYNYDGFKANDWIIEERDQND